jgi:radical SAM protein with 4Fe4S-binding SPASM domain
VDCEALPSVAYGDFSIRLHSQAAQQRLPISGSLELTARCNLHCRFCYLPHPQRAAHEARHELQTGEWLEILDQMAAAGCLWLLLTGGEILLRDDFAELYVAAKRRGFIVTLFTNGTLLSDATADLIARLPPFAVEIPLYGATAHVYERMTGQSGSFQRCMQAIDTLLQRRIQVRLKSVVTTLNVEELPAMVALAQRKGLPFRYDPHITSGIDGNRCTLRYRLSPQAIVELDRADPGRSEAWRELCRRARENGNYRTQLYNCGAGQIAFYIDSSGRMCLCSQDRSSPTDVLRRGFEHAWRQLSTRRSEEQFSRETPCSRCEYMPVCGWCPSWSRNEATGAEAPVPFLCEVTRLRVEQFGSDVDA